MSTNTKQTSACFKREWDKIEDVNTYPHYLRNIIIIDANEFVSQVNEASDDDIKKFVSSIYGGDAYILKNAFSADFVDNLKEKVYQPRTFICVF